MGLLSQMRLIQHFLVDNVVEKRRAV